MTIKTRSFFKKLLRDTSANVSMMFAGTSLAILAATGLAVDYMGMQSAQAELQGQVDLTVLALAKSGVTDLDKLDELALLYMQGNGYSPNLPAPTVIVGSDGVIRVEATAEYDVTVMRILGHDNTYVGAFAESSNETLSSVEIALVLDTTESMEGDKIAALRLAAGNLVRSFEDGASEDVKVGLVPFGEYVNIDSVGMDNRNAAWSDVPDDWSETETYTQRTKISEGYCKVARTTRTYMDDGVWVVDDNYCSDWENSVYADDGVQKTREKTYEWQGCVGSRDSNLHKQDGSYAIRVPGLLNEWCAAPIVPLTSDYNAVGLAIYNMPTRDSTYMPAGLMWGQRILSPSVPYSEGSSDPDTQKILVLMTDGLNTMKLGDNYEHDELDMSDPGEAIQAAQTNLDTAEICRTVKVAGTTIYTIAFEVPDAATKTMLEVCASSTSHYFDATGSDELVAAFDSIVSQLHAVRILK